MSDLSEARQYAADDIARDGDELLQIRGCGANTHVIAVVVHHFGGDRIEIAVGSSCPVPLAREAARLLFEALDARIRSASPN
jgi:hypothetical protein